MDLRMTYLRRAESHWKIVCCVDICDIGIGSRVGIGLHVIYLVRVRLHSQEGNGEIIVRVSKLFRSLTSVIMVSPTSVSGMTEPSGATDIQSDQLQNGALQNEIRFVHHVT